MNQKKCELIKKTFEKFLKPRNIEQAIEYMTEQDRIIQHEFYKDTFSDKGNCDICGFRRNSHLKDKEKKRFLKNC